MKDFAKDYISTLDASKIANVEDRTVRRWCKLGYIESFKINETWVVLKRSLERFLTEKKGMEL